jgi:hypothetical protein
MSFTDHNPQKLQNLLTSRLQLTVDLAGIDGAVDTNTVAALSFCPVKGRISHFDKLDRIARIVGKRRNANTYRNVMLTSAAP